MCAAEVDHNVARRYVLKRRLGKGDTAQNEWPCVCRDNAYGIVWKAVDRRTGEIVAIKKIFDAFRDKTDAQRTFREIMLLQEFGDHPNIIRLLDLMQAENDRDIYLVFEFMDTDLHAVIRKGGLLKDIHRRYIFYQLLWATNFIHSAQVIHRDLKPSNILLDANCMVKVCDFGLARSLSSLPEGTEGQALTNYVATRWYRAPEVLLSSSWYTPGVDMWSLGCVLGEMLRGQPLFPGTSTLHQLQLILETIPPPLEEELSALGSGCSTSILHSLGSRPQQMLDTILPPDTPPEALDLLRLLLVFAPHKRLTAAQALQHPYVQRFHCSGCDQIGRADVQLLAQDGVQLSATEYRSRIYQMILEQRSNGCVLKKEGLRGAPLGAEPRASRSYAHLLKPRAGPQLSLGPPVQNPGLMPQSSPSLDPEHGPLSLMLTPTCRSLLSFPQTLGLAGRCSALLPHRGPWGLPGPCSGATLRPMVPSATQHWAACPCSQDHMRELPYLPSPLPLWLHLSLGKLGLFGGVDEDPTHTLVTFSNKVCLSPIHLPSFHPFLSEGPTLLLGPCYP
ncbi:mitogen-activated protein kinase 15 isoform X4 [Nycticebus coucang]|uniref:mitogen-activated protein kinase 15 isoform X4 n=1 Tax=Nycticebus coucang TaxID=9470 RepID=UPI00234C0A5D|nr:mitogen-activated protein kinase 15 isoform X4 [Nycticebus coucang]